MGEEISKDVLAEQVSAIIGGMNLLLTTNEMSLRNRNVVKRMKENAEQMLENLNPQKLSDIQSSFKEKRVDSHGNVPLSGMPEEAKLSVLQSYSTEVKQISEELENYLKEDLDMFRIKVHGIKSTSKQLGFLRMGENAEIMEMAAKTENLSFIQRNLKSFLADLKITLEDVKKEYEELASLMEQNQKRKNASGGEADGNQSSEELFFKLKLAFDGYELDQIESLIETLNYTSLGEREKEVLEKVKTAAAELEYELGSKLLAEIGRQ